MDDLQARVQAKVQAVLEVQTRVMQNIENVSHELDSLQDEDQPPEVRSTMEHARLVRELRRAKRFARSLMDQLNELAEVLETLESLGTVAEGA